MSAPRLDRPRIARTHVAPALAAATVLAIGAASFRYTVDDAFVIARYAARLARGLGWTFQGTLPSDGVTGPLAIVPGVIGAWLGLDPAIASKACGLLCGATAVVLTVRAAARHALGGPSAAIVGALASCNATLPIWSQAGLETGLATLAATIACLAAIARPGPRGLVLGVAIGSLAWLRPELTVLGMALAAIAVSRDRRAGAASIVIGAPIAVGVIAWRLALFGTIAPLAFSAKPPELARGAEYVARGIGVATGLAGIVLAGLGARRSRALRALLGVIVIQVIAIAVAGGDWMPGFRLFAPLVPAYALIAGIGGARAVSLSRGRRKTFAIALVAFAIGLPALDAIVQVPRAREAGEAQDRIGRSLARALAELAGETPIAMVDVGLLAYVGGFDVVDLAGITDPEIARLPGRHLDKRVEPALLEARGVRVIVLRSFAPPRVRGARLESIDAEPVEVRIAASAWAAGAVVERVVPWSENYHYVVLVRDASRHP